MSHTPDPLAQHWALLGTAAASEQIWGLRRIEFPCGYHIPPIAIAPADAPLQRPAPGREVWAMAGYALVVKGGGKDLDPAAAAGLVAGYRPWLGLFHDALLDELDTRGHTVRMWDRGVSIFYGLWREHCHALGALVPAAEAVALTRLPVQIEAGAARADGEALADYAHDGAAVISFMSQFMTLSDGDTYILGPLAAVRLTADSDRIALGCGSLRIERAVAG